jgi:anti-anti-sigma factor
VGDELDIQVEERPEACILRLIGSAGIKGIKPLEQAILRICAKQPKLVIMDFAQVTLLASLAMGQLVAANRSLSRSGGKIRLVAVPESVIGSLKHAHLDSLFQFFPNVEAALAS